MSIKTEEGVVTIDGDDLKKLQDGGRAYLESVRPAEGTPAHSPAKTPWAVLCPIHGQQFLTSDEYNRQLCRPDSLWTCPDCGKASQWDDDNYEASFDEPEPE